MKIHVHIVTQNNLMMDPENIEVVKNRQVPNKVKNVQQFIGLCGFYCKILENSIPFVQFTSQIQKIGLDSRVPRSVL